MDKLTPVSKRSRFAFPLRERNQAVYQPGENLLDKYPTPFYFSSSDEEVEKQPAQVRTTEAGLYNLYKPNIGFRISCNSNVSAAAKHSRRIAFGYEERIERAAYAISRTAFYFRREDKWFI